MRVRSLKSYVLHDAARATAPANTFGWGDLVRAAETISVAVQSPEPPLHLVLGKPALDIVRKKLTALGTNFDIWEATTLGVNFPDAVGCGGKKA